MNTVDELCFASALTLSMALNFFLHRCIQENKLKMEDNRDVFILSVGSAPNGMHPKHA
jgi:hypothetical protein